MKKVLIILAIVVVVLGGGTAVLVANLDKVVNSKKDYLLDKAETTLGRDVTIDDIGVTLSGGIGVKLTNVAIADDPAFSDAGFVTAKDLTIRVKFWPLLKKQVEVKRLVLNEPVINVIRSETGVLNVTTIASGGDRAGSTTEAGGEASGKQPAAAASLALAFADIKNGTFRFDDRGSGVVIDINRVDLKVKNAGLGKVGEIEFAAAIFAEDQNVELEGSVGPIDRLGAPADLAPTPVRLEVSIGPLSADEIRGVLPESPQLKKLEDLKLGDVQMSFKVGGTMGALEMSDAVVKSSLLGAQEPNVLLRADVGPLDVTGPVGHSNNVNFSAQLQLKPISLAAVSDFIVASSPTKAKSGGEPPLPPELSLAGDCALEATVSGSADGLRVDLDVDLTDGSIEFADKFRKPAGVPLRARSKIGYSQLVMAVESAKVTLADLNVDATGGIDMSNLYPMLDLSIRSNETDVSKLAGLLPALQPMSVGGIVRLAATIKSREKDAQNPSVNGSLEIENGRATLEQLPEPVSNVNAIVSFTDQSARLEQTSLRVGRSMVKAQGSAETLQPLKANYKLTAAEAHRTDFHKPPKPSPRPEVLRDVKIEGRIWQEGKKIKHVGTASSPSGLVANVDYRNMTASIASDDDKVVIEKFSADALGGKLEGSGTFEPKKQPPKFTLETRVRQVNLAEYFKYKVKSVPKFIEGRIDLDLGLAGAGKEWKEISRTLSGEGGALVVRGALLNVNFASDLFANLEQIPMVDRAALARVRQSNPNLFASDKTAFKDLKADVRIDNGRIHSNGLVLKTDDFSLYGSGWVSFDRQVNFKSSIVFSNQATQSVIRELSIAKYLTNDKGQLDIPILLTGPVTRPVVMPDTDALTKKLQAAALDSGIDQLKDRLGDQLGGQVKDLFKGFGKKKSDSKPDSSKSR